MLRTALVPIPMVEWNRAGVRVASVVGVATLGALLGAAFRLGGVLAGMAVALSLAAPFLLWCGCRGNSHDNVVRCGALVLLSLSVPWAFLEPVIGVVHVVGAGAVLLVRPGSSMVARARDEAPPAERVRPHPLLADMDQGVHLRAGPPMQILLVEDNAANRFYGSVVLRRLGHSFDVVSSGAQALAAVQARRYDAVLMDVRMPGMDGVETAAAIRARLAPHLRPAIVALTADDRPQTRRELLEHGMDGYLTKPLRPEQLQQTLAQMTGTVRVVA